MLTAGWAAALTLVGGVPQVQAQRARAMLDGAACEAAADETEREAGLPTGLLRAIGIVESGRWQPTLARSAPWPYAIDAGGYSMFMESLDDAIAKVGALRQQGLASIDVGCFQINLLYHPGAFATLDEAFDPKANATYAAHFLQELYGRAGTWEGAVADYHSAVPSLGDPYRARVYAVWQGGATSVSVGHYTVATAAGLSRSPADRPSAARTAGWTSFSFPGRNLDMRVYVPMTLVAPTGGTEPQPVQRPAPASRRLVSMTLSRRKGLPMVYGPTATGL